MTRMGIMGLLERESSRILPHEETIPARVEAMRRSLSDKTHDPGPLWLWCNDPAGDLQPHMELETPADLRVSDRFGCLHEYWKIESPGAITDLQGALGSRALFLADGHHRYAAGWNLAVIQVRNRALQSLASHRLLRDAEIAADIPAQGLVNDVEQYLAATPEARRRFVLYAADASPRGFEVSDDAWSARRWLQAGVASIRDPREAMDAVRRRDAGAALLMSRPSVSRIEQDAALGRLLPPKSTDFFPKLAAGLVMHYA